MGVPHLGLSATSVVGVRGSPRLPLKRQVGSSPGVDMGGLSHRGLCRAFPGPGEGRGGSLLLSQRVAFSPRTRAAGCSCSLPAQGQRPGHPALEAEAHGKVDKGKRAIKGAGGESSWHPI